MLRKLRVGKRLSVAFALLVLVSIIVGAVAMYRFSETATNLNNIADRRLPAALLVGEMSREFLMVRLYTVNILLATDDTERQQHWQTLKDKLKAYDVAASQAAEFHKTPAGRAAFDKVQSAKQQYDSLHEQMLRMMEQGRHSDASAFRSQGLNAAAAAVTASLVELGQYQQQTAGQQAAMAKHSIALADITMMVAIGFAVVFGAVLSVLFSRSLLGPVQHAVEVSQRIAAGDLSQQFSDDAPDEAGDLIRAMAQMQQQLQHTLKDINQSSSQLAATSEELSTVTEQSSRTQHQQSLELEMAATAVTELTTAIEEVARNAAATSHNSEQADEKARQGQQRVAHTIESIQSLDSDLLQARQGIEQLAGRVQQIGSVLDVIRAIADQTNLLALNAAIEAARAGESGRGFAVVADEVRALAHRTQESTKEIEQMMRAVQAETQNTVSTMSQSSERAGQTLQIARQAGDALQLIAQAIAQISDQNLTIASAAEEQATVAREVDGNLVNIRDLSSQTAEGAHETQAASAELARLAEHLHDLVVQFKV